MPCIKVRMNSRVRLKKGRNIFRNLSVLAQRNDLQKCEDRALAMMDKNARLQKPCFLV